MGYQAVLIYLLAVAITTVFGAVFQMEMKIGDPLELELGKGPLIWARTLDSAGVNATKQYLFPCACNNGSWTDGVDFFGKGATASWDGKLRIEEFSAEDAGSYSSPNEEVHDPRLPRTLIVVSVKKAVKTDE